MSKLLQSLRHISKANIFYGRCSSVRSPSSCHATSTSIPAIAARGGTQSSLYSRASATVVPKDDDVGENYEDISLVVSAVNSCVASPDLGRLFAVIHLDGRQRKVTTEDIIVIDREYDADAGDRIRLNKVMLIGGRDFSLVGRPVLSPQTVRVEATVLEKTLSHDVIWYRYRPRRNWNRFKVARIKQTFLRINSIQVSSLCDEST